MAKRNTREKVDWEFVPVRTAQGVSVNEKIEAKAWRAHTKALERKHGKFTCRQTWEEIADKPDHPCYPAFEWDDQIAGAKYRDSQGQLMLRGLRTTIVHQDKEHFKVRAIVCTEKDKETGGSYQDITTAVKSLDSMDLLLQDALNELVRYRKRWRVLNELNDLTPQLEVIDGVIHVMRDMLAKGA